MTSAPRTWTSTRRVCRPSSCAMDGRLGPRRVRLHVPGRQVVGDVLLAMAVIALLWVSIATPRRMPSPPCPATSMRLSVATSPAGVRVIDDSYNAAPTRWRLRSTCYPRCAVTVAGLRCSARWATRRPGGLAFTPSWGVRCRQSRSTCSSAWAARSPPPWPSQPAPWVSSDDRIVTFPTVEEMRRPPMRPVLGEGDLVLVKGLSCRGTRCVCEGMCSPDESETHSIPPTRLFLAVAIFGHRGPCAHAVLHPLSSQGRDRPADPR